MLNNNIKTSTKVLLLLILSTLLFLLLYFSLYYYTIKQEQEIRTLSYKQFDNEINSLLELNSESIKSMITEMTYWDEFVDYTKSRDKEWFLTSLNSVENFKVDYLAVYDKKYDFIDKKSTSKIKSIIPIDIGLFKILDKKKLLKFYLTSPEGVLEVIASTIHPSFDPSRTYTNPSGYCIVMRLLDKDYLKNIETIIGSNISLNISKESNIDKTILIAKNLNSWNGETVAAIYFKREFNLEFKATRNILVILIIAFIINLIFIAYYSQKLIFKPLRLITRILESDNKKVIASLMNTPGEFGYIGNLFHENSHQKKELQKAKLKAEESDRLKSSFLTNLSHEIRTPMNAIVGFSDLLSNSKITEQERLQYLGVISQSGSSLVLIIEDLIEMSKIDARQITPKESSLDLHSCVLALYNTIKITIPKEKKIDFKLINQEQSLTKNILTDQTKLKQILTNLITNAIKYTDQGEVSFGYEVNAKKNSITFTIVDSGLGIDENHHKIIFDRFRRIDSDYSVKVGGLGLGLAISKAYVDMLGGTISLQSKLGKGSTFVVTIPLHIDETHLEKEIKKNKINAHSNKGSELILIAEDDNINYLLLEKVMQLKNYNIIRAKDGLQAVELCTTNKNINLVLMDIKMPVLNGFEAIVKIHKIRPELQLIAQTAYSSPEDEEKIKRAGFVDYITKPINKEKLFELIDQYLR